MHLIKDKRFWIGIVVGLALSTATAAVAVRTSSPEPCPECDPCLDVECIEPVCPELDCICPSRLKCETCPELEPCICDECPECEEHTTHEVIYRSNPNCCPVCNPDGCD